MDRPSRLQNTEPIDDDFIFQRIDSGEIVYTNPNTKYKTVGKYAFGNKIGEGSYAKVKECLHTETLQRCAVKIMKQKTLRKIPHGVENVAVELSLLRQLRHPNVVQLYDVHTSAEKAKIYMMMEYCVIGLQEMLEAAPEGKLPVCQAHGYFVQLLCGLEYLHGRGVIHKDIKPGNLLLAQDHTLKIIDFGVAELLPPGQTLVSQSQGSPMFQPPEVAGGSYTEYPGETLDIWSSGCTLFNMTSGQYPFNGANIFRIFESVCNDPLVIPGSLDTELSDLLTRMLAKEPYERIGLQGVKRHRWVQSAPPSPSATPLPHRPCSVLPFLHGHHFPEEIEPYVTEHQLGVSRGHAEEASPRRKKAKGGACITLRAFGGCTQS